MENESPNQRVEAMENERVEETSLVSISARNLQTRGFSFQNDEKPESVTSLEVIYRAHFLKLLYQYKHYVENTMQHFLSDSDMDVLSLVLEEPLLEYDERGYRTKSDECVHVLLCGRRRGLFCGEKTVSFSRYCKTHHRNTCLHCKRRVSFNLYCKVHAYDALSRGGYKPKVMIYKDCWNRNIHKATLLAFNDNNEVCGAISRNPTDSNIYELDDDDYECIIMFNFSVQINYLPTMIYYNAIRRLREDLYQRGYVYGPFFTYYDNDTGEIVYSCLKKDTTLYEKYLKE